MFALSAVLSVTHYIVRHCIDFWLQWRLIIWQHDHVLFYQRNYKDVCGAVDGPVWPPNFYTRAVLKYILVVNVEGVVDKHIYA